MSRAAAVVATAVDAAAVDAVAVVLVWLSSLLSSWLLRWSK